MVSRTYPLRFDPPASPWLRHGSGLNNFSLSLLAVSLNMIIRPWNAVVVWLFHRPGSFERRHMMEIDMGFRLGCLKTKRCECIVCVSHLNGRKICQAVLS